MEKALEELGSLDPSDSMEGIMTAVAEVLKELEKDPESGLTSEALSIISKQENRTRDYYMRPFDSDEIYNSLVQLHLARGETEMADLYRRCLDLRQARKWTIIGDSYALMGLNSRAVKFLKRALFFGPAEDLVDEVQKAHDKAFKRMQKAETDVKATIAKLDKDPTHQKNLAKALTYLIDLDRLDDAEKMIKGLPKDLREDADILYRKGCILFGNDDFKKARTVFQKVLEMTPNSTNAKRAFNLSEEMIKGIN
ncbi:MAG: tetratricopeptide repeat protein [Thermoplasmatota archaeon]